MIAHTIQSLLLYTLLYGCYVLFLKKETFFQFNRFYLVAIPFIALLLPFLQLPIKSQIDAILGQEKQVSIMLQEDLTATVITPMINQEVTDVSQPTNWSAIILGIYILGAVLAFLLWCYKLAVIEEFIENASPIFKKRYRIMKSERVQGGFSFLDMIFINPQTEDSLNEVIINHELVHVQQRHSWDLIVHECVRVVFWFNPLLVKAHQDLQATHEFIVDSKLALQDVNNYKSQLLQSIMHCPEYTLTNSFYKSSILKNRIAMLQKTKSPFYRILKLGALIPIIAITIGYNATAQTAPAEPEEPQILKVKNNSQTDYPRLSEFVYGKVNLNEGLTDEEIKHYENRKVFPDGWDTEEFKNYRNSKEHLQVLKIGRIRNANSITVVRNDQSDNTLVEIHEGPDSPFFASLGSNFKKGMSNKEYRALLRQIQRNKPLSEFEMSEEMYDKIIKYFNTKENADVKVVVETKMNKEQSTGQPATEKTIPFAVIYKVPSLDVCTGNNDVLKKCVRDEITKHVNENFNTDVISKENKGKHQIAVQFKINKEGKVVDISAKSKFPELTQEAFRVIELLPTFIPGEIESGEKVGVIYGLPIIFQI